MKIDWEPLREIIADNERFVLSSHVRPDADALGSELAMAMLLENLGKSVRIVNPSALPDNLFFLDPGNRVMKIGKDISAEDVLDTDVHVILDTSAWVQLVDVGKVLRKTKAKRVVIDHHVSSDNLGAVEFKDTTAEATGALHRADGGCVGLGNHAGNDTADFLRDCDRHRLVSVLFDQRLHHANHRTVN